MISYIVSSFNKPLQLITCITALLVQKGDKEIIIVDNTTKKADRDYIRMMLDPFIDFFGKPTVQYIDTHKDFPPDLNAGYAAQNYGTTLATGEWLCFPCEDIYHVPGFQEIMLETAKDFSADFVYCDFLYDPRYNQIISKGIYQVVPAYPRPRFCDKCNFIVKKELFTGFELQENGYGDMFLHLKMFNEGVKMAKAPGVLVVHN